MAGSLKVVVVGAGALGGWTALKLRRAGCTVTLVDAWGAGNARASSGGETRALRCGYGPSERYTRLARRARGMWLEEEQRLGFDVYREIGFLWLFAEEDAYTDGTLANLRKCDVPHEPLTREEVALRWPQISTAGVRSALYEPEAGYLLANEACRRVVRCLVAEGGEFLLAEARPGTASGAALREVDLGAGKTTGADFFVFACGAWLPEIFPELLGERLFPTRQEVFFFGTPPGDARWEDTNLPAWVEYGEFFWYGIPGNRGRGFKVADDTRGEVFDPTWGERTATQAGEAAARTTLARRFPALAGAPLVGARVCQYTDTRNGEHLCELHPEWRNVLLLGGGGGHCFKHGPAIGAEAAAMVLEAAR